MVLRALLMRVARERFDNDCNPAFSCEAIGPHTRVLCLPRELPREPRTCLPSCQVAKLPRVCCQDTLSDWLFPPTLGSLLSCLQWAIVFCRLGSFATLIRRKRGSSTDTRSWRRYGKMSNASPTRVAKSRRGRLWGSSALSLQVVDLFFLGP